MLKLVVSKTEKTLSGAVITGHPAAIFDAETSARKLAIIEGADAVIEAVRKLTGLDLDLQIVVTAKD
jgi:hypothetical protein